jgi:L-threonylcarbamoyladenylate synthase
MISHDIYKAAQFLNNEEIVAIPTETVYGLAANIYSEKAIQSIFDLKKRPLTNPLIVHIGSLNQLNTLTENVPELAFNLIEKFWPGPLTLVLKKTAAVPNSITAGKNTVAIRMPNHPQTLKLLNILSFPIAAPSANPFGSISPTMASHVENYFKEKLPMVLNGGNCQKGIESTIIGFENELPVLYRLGSITIEEIENEIGPVVVKNFKEQHPNAPGMMAKHYAPTTKTIVTTDIFKTIEHHNGKRIGLMLFNKVIDNKDVQYQEILSKEGNLEEAATHLYAALHRLDKLQLDVIIVEEFPENQLGRSINDRLKRASTI